MLHLPPPEQKAIPFPATVLPHLETQATKVVGFPKLWASVLTSRKLSGSHAREVDVAED